MPPKSFSKFRHCVFKEKATQRFTDLRVANASLDSNMITANRYLTAYNWLTNSNGAIAVSVLSQPGRRKTNEPLIQAHGSTVTDLALSRFVVGDSSILYTGGDDGYIKVWTVPNTGLSKPMSDPTATLHGNRRVTSVKPHPLASEIVASGNFNKEVVVWDVAQETDAAKITTSGNVWDISWSGDGKLLASMTANKKVGLLDMRATDAVVSEIDGEVGVKPARSVWAGPTGTEYLVTTSFSKFRERIINVYDPKNMSKSVKRMTHDTSSGILMPFYDYDSSVLGLAGKGDSTLRLFDVGNTGNVLTELTSFSGSTTHKGVAMGVKTSCKVMECEVLYFLRLCPNRIERVGVMAPRKTHFDFHEDLFPETIGDESVLTGKEWLGGEDKAPVKVSLDPQKRKDEAPTEFKKTLSPNSGTQSPSSLRSSGANSPSSVGDRGRPRSFSEETRNATGAESPVDKAANRRSGRWVESKIKDMSNIIRSTRFRHVYAKLWKKEEGCSHMKPKLEAIHLLSVNDKYVAVPWSGAGGRVGIVPLPLPTRTKAEDMLMADPQKSEVTALKFSHFEKDTFLVGYQDASVSLFKVPDEVCTFKQEMDFYGHELKISALEWSPVAANIFLSASQDGSIKVWDAEQAEPVCNVDIGEAVLDAKWDVEGNYIFATTRDCKVHAVDPRGGVVVKSAVAHETDKGFKVIPMNHSRIMTCGISKSSGRELKVYDALSLELQSTIPIDNNNGVLFPQFDFDTGILFVVGKGGTTMFIYELSDESPYLHHTTEVKGQLPVIGGIDAFHKTTCDVKKCEVRRFAVYSNGRIDLCSFFVPRNNMEYFQDPIFAPTFADMASMKAADWIAGKTEEILMLDLCPEGMERLSDHPELTEKKTTVRRFVEDEETTSNGVDKDEIMKRVSGYMNEHETEIMKWQDPARKIEGVQDDEWGDDEDDEWS